MAFGHLVKKSLAEQKENTLKKGHKVTFLQCIICNRSLTTKSSKVKIVGEDKAIILCNDCFGKVNHLF